MSTYNATNFLIYLNKYLPVLHDIGGGGKRKPPPMHQMRRLREPGKIHQRRQDCFCKAVPFLCVFPMEFLRLPSDASHVRVWPICSASRAGILFCRGDWDRSVSPWHYVLYQKFRPAAELSRRESSRRRPIRALSAGRSL